MIQIIPTVLTSDPFELKNKISLVEELVQRVQMDIIDGQFAATKTVDPLAVQYIDTNLMLDFHLMTKEPVNWVEKCIRGGADRIIGQIEMMGSQQDFLAKLQEVGCRSGLALDLKTGIDALEKEVLTDVDVVLLMSVPAGAGGQEFDSTVLDKIKMLNQLRVDEGHNFVIVCDGGIGPHHLDLLSRLGVDEVAIGKSVFEGNVAQNLIKLNQAAQNES